MFPYRQILFALVAPLLLGACLLTPGKFDSTLDIRADRSFTFTYKGEVVALDMAKDMAEALSKESGYKSARYVGNSTFLIDYEVHGTLDHGFVYPFNVDAEIVFPFIVVELRGADMVRMKAPGYANSDNKKGGMGGMTPPGPESTLDGTFTLTTNAEIISQNNENGSVTAPNGRRIVWKATPLTKDEPMAVLRVAPLK